MNGMPELSDDAVIELAREGGVAFIPKFAEPRRITLAQLSADKRAAVCQTLQAALALAKPASEASDMGSGDRRYFRIEISWTTRPQGTSVVVLIAEQDAPATLQSLWRDAVQ
ncbi:hypothetical protein BTJ39_19705 [Izhakiella australiensis]|uniref:Uncharacterized protein n=1 Tax=Izhakiella australiensis TaxID=1926881 RepID=A0A1S8YFQ7_9GAMM|nr:protealysin inhibitor emfourin [Izhakiella australiensis]OON37563.1 hypothetical protein BTJ39_19705 [Izhakiella australiensis]